MNRAVLDRWCRGALIASALCGHAAFLFVQARVGIYRVSLGPTLGWIIALTAIALPFITVRVAEFLYESGRLKASKVPHIFVLEWFLVLLASTESPSLFMLAAVVMLLGHTLPRLKSNAFAAWSLAASLTLCLTAAATVPSLHWLWFIPLTLIVVGAAVVLLHARHSLAQRDSVRRWSFMSQSRSTSTLPGPARLALYGFPFVLLALLAIPFFSFGIVSLPVPLSEARRASTGRRAVASTLQPHDAADAAARAAFEGVFPSDLSYGRGVSQLQHETVMIVTPPEHVTERDFRARAPYYLRGLVQDRFSETGAVFGGGDSMREVAAGSDQWATLNEARPELTLELEIHQQPLLTRQGAWNILFSTQPALAVRTELVKFDPDGVLVSLSGNDQWKHYAVRSGIDDARAWRLAGAKAEHPDERYVNLPPSSEALEKIRSEALRITAGAGDDVARVEAVVSHFTRHFAYTLEAADTPGLEGVVEFLDRRRGHCTSFAAGSALLLRTLNIPARVATGFLVDNWSETAGGYPVTTLNGHAWLEVYYEEFGWLRYEPTPAERRLRALRASAQDHETSFTAWLSDLTSDLTYWASSGADESDLRLAAQTLADGPRALLASLRRAPLAVAGWGVGLALAWFVLMRSAARRTRSRQSRTTRPKVAEQDSYARLLLALEKHGHTKPVQQTPREFAKCIAASHEPWRDIIPVTELLYRARFGGEQLSQNERESFEALTRAVAAG